MGARATRWHCEPGTFRPPARETPDGELLYIVTDHLGTPREMFSEAGKLRWAAEYRTWGEVRRLWLASNDNEPAAVNVRDVVLTSIGRSSGPRADGRSRY